MRALLALVSVLGFTFMSGEAEAAPRGGKSGLEVGRSGKAHGKGSDKSDKEESEEGAEGKGGKGGKGGKKKGPGKAAANPGSKPSARAPGKDDRPRSSLPEKEEEEEKVAGTGPSTGGKAGTKPGSGKPKGQRPGQTRPGQQEVGAGKPWQNKPGESEESEVVKAPNRGVEARPVDPRAPRQPGMPAEEEESAPSVSTTSKAPERRPQQPHLETTFYLHGVAGMSAIGLGGEEGAMLAGLEAGVEGWEVGGSQLVTRSFNLRASADRTFAESQVDRLQVSAAVGAWARVIGAQVGPAIDFSRAGSEEAEVGLGLQAVGLIGGPTASLWAGVKPVLVDATGQDQELQLAGVGGLSLHMNNLSMGVGAEARDGGGSPELEVTLGLGFAF